MERPFEMPITVPPPREAILALLDDLRVLRENGHFVYVSGVHADNYFQKNLALANAFAAAGIAFHIARSIVDQFPGAVLLAPASGGIGLVQLVADAATRMWPDGRYVALYAEKVTDGGFEMKRNADLLDLNLPLIGIEDVVTTGKSIRDVETAATRHNGRRFDAVRCICDRGVDVTTFTTSNFWAFLELLRPVYQPDTCPMCAEGKRIDTDLGHGKDYVAKHGQPQRTTA